MTTRLLALLPLLLLWPATAAAQAPPPCAQPGEAVRAESAEAMVLERQRGGGRDPEWFVCDRTTGRRQALTTSAARVGTVGYGPFAASGTKVAFVYSYGDRTGYKRQIVVVDVREGLPSADFSGTPVTRFDPGVFGARREPSVRALAVSPDGRVAYRTARAVHVSDPDGSTRTVDHARPGRLEALAITSDRVTWRHAGVERSTALTPPPHGCGRPPTPFGYATDELVVAGGRTRAWACVRAGGRGFVRFTSGLQVAGTLVASRRRGTVRVTDLTTGAGIGRPIEVRDRHWLLGPGGTIVVLGPRRVVAHHPDGTRADLGAPPSAIRPRLIDPVLGRVVLGSGGQTFEVPLSPPCGARLGEQVLARGDGVVVVADRMRVRGIRYRRYALCEGATARRTTLLLGPNHSDGGTGATAFTFAGRHVAWSETSSAKGVSDSRIVIRDLDALDDPAAQRTIPIRVGADALAISPDGRRAAAALQTRLVLFDGGLERTVDRAIAGTLNDLAFDGDTLSWRHGGQERRVAVPLPAACTPPGDGRALAQDGDAVAGARSTGDVDRSTPVLCRFAGEGWTELPGEGAARIAGPYAASATRREVVVRDLATLAPIGVPVPLAGDGSWALLATGAVVVRDAHGLALHRLDGRVVTWQPRDVAGGFAVDELARHLVWELYNQLPGSTPLPPGE